ncbi:GlsB/YeaQ/YmgE family stress response membrane protein [Streptomyces sp. NP160]|uniref:GlsB/YeaQ/YmgE family stress response membrane protein n=1 Tax=Streptomyces sp. NP160 TaxID=2586637 RepID=UPI001C5778E9|nr:GlsB/YeaQ/YmgE family stress response membrane protein [Streptomyces sp. NP160]
MLGTMIGIGIIAGYIARLVVPGRSGLGVGGTLLLGVVGSSVGGFLGRLLFGRGESLVQPSSWIGSIIGAIIVLAIYRATQGRRRA